MCPVSDITEVPPQESEDTVDPVCTPLYKHVGRLLRLTLSYSCAVTPTPQVCYPGSSHVDDKPWTGFGEAARDMTVNFVQERGQSSSRQCVHTGFAKAPLGSGVGWDNTMHTGTCEGSRSTQQLQVTARIDLPGFARAGRQPPPSTAPFHDPPNAIAADSTATYYSYQS